MYSIDEIAGVSKKAFQEGYAQGLEAAANMDIFWRLSDEIPSILRAEAERVREMGVNNDVSK